MRPYIGIVSDSTSSRSFPPSPKFRRPLIPRSDSARLMLLLKFKERFSGRRRSAQSIHPLARQPKERGIWGTNHPEAHKPPLPIRHAKSTMQRELRLVRLPPQWPSSSLQESPSYFILSYLDNCSLAVREEHREREEERMK